MLYVDASALVKLVLTEPESEALRELLASRDDLVTSAVAVVEVVRAARRASSSSKVLARARAVVRSVHLLAVDLRVLDRAGDLEPDTLRTLDAIHLASALSVDADLEAMVVAVEQAPSRMAAAGQLRTEIELPGALRYLDRLCRAVHGTLAAVRGLEPERFEAVAPTLMGFSALLSAGSVMISLRAWVARYLPQLPTPFGFDPHRRALDGTVERHQLRRGPDPPAAILEAPA